MQRIAFVLMLGLACVFSLAGAHAADDPFTVSGISVDATAASASVAQNIAINQGRGRAWNTLYRRLTKQQDWARQPPLDDITLQRMIKNYGYCEICSTDVLNFVASIFARGDAKD